MNPAALLVLVALGYWLVQTSAHRRNPRRVRNEDLVRARTNPRRRRRPGGPGQLELPEAPASYPVVHVAGGGKLPNRKKQPYWVFAQWAGVPSSDLRWFTHDPVGRTFTSYAEAADVGRDFARQQGGVFEASREARHELLRRRNPAPWASRRGAHHHNPRRARANPTTWSTSDRPPQGMSRAEFLKRLRLRPIGNGYYVRQDVAGTGWTLVYPSGDTRSGHPTRAAAELRAERHRGVMRNPAPWATGRGVQTSAQTCRCGSGAPCRNPYTQACQLPGGHVYDFAAGGRCQCCGRLAPRRTVELESRSGEHARYGRTCAARSIGTTKLRTNQLEHMDREAAERSGREAHYRGAGRQASGIARPTFARGWSEADITELARQVGVSPFEPNWWLSQAANLVPGHYQLTPQGRRYVPPTGEYRRYVTEGGQRGHGRRRGVGSSARSARPARARAYARPGDDLPW